MLIIDACVRCGDSATRRYYEAYLESLPEKPMCEIIYLDNVQPKPLTAETLQKRDALLRAGRLDDGMFRLAKQFRDADEILVAAPFWDLSFPAVLKAYFENVSVAGLTFRYTETGSVGLCRAKKLTYFSTAGGFTNGNHLGYEYVRALAGLFGISETVLYSAEGLDIDPARREAVLADAIARL